MADPAFQPESRQIAIALSERGGTFRFHTSAYFGRASLVFRLAARMPPRLRASINERLLRRLEPSIDDSAIRNWILPDVLRRGAHRFHVPDYVAQTIIGRWFDGIVAQFVPHDVDVVVAIQGSALGIFRRGRTLGARTVLIANTPDAESEAEIIRAEEERAGLQPRRCVVRARAKLVRRVHAEYAVADLVLTNSDFTRSDLIAHGVAPHKVIALPLGVDQGKFRARPRKTSTQERSRTALFVGGVHARKGVVYMARALEELRREGIDVVGRAVGIVDPNYAQILKPFIEAGTLILEGPKSHHRLEDEYACADVFVFPTLSDGFGLVVLEAMACGVPVIVTDRCGAPVQDGKNALVVPNADEVALGRAIRRVLTEPELASVLRAAALETARLTSWEQYRASALVALSEVARDPVAPSAPRRLVALQHVGRWLPAVRGRHLVLRYTAALLGLSLSRPRVVHDEVGGDIVVDPRFRGPMRNAFFGYMTEKPTQLASGSVLRHGDLVIDVGANFGGLSRRFAALVGRSGRVEAFEPNSRIFEYLEQNARIAPNGNVTVHQVALGRVTEQRALRICEPASDSRMFSDGMSSFTARLEKADREELVEVRSLDEFLPNATPALLKVDVEGWEADVLAGARAMLARMTQSRSLLIVEAHLSNADSHANALYLEVVRLCDAGMRAALADEHTMATWTGARNDGNLLLFGMGVERQILYNLGVLTK